MFSMLNLMKFADTVIVGFNTSMQNERRGCVEMIFDFRASKGTHQQVKLMLTLLKL